MTSGFVCSHETASICEFWRAFLWAAGGHRFGNLLVPSTVLRFAEFGRIWTHGVGQAGEPKWVEQGYFSRVHVCTKCANRLCRLDATKTLFDPFWRAAVPTPWA